MKQTAKIIAMLAIGMQATGLHAVPAMPGAMRMTQPDGTEITVRLYGDESGHYYLSDDGYPLRRDDDGFFYYRTGFSGSTASVRAHDKSARTPDEQAFLATIDKKSAVNHTVLRTAATRRNSPLLKASSTTTYPTKGKQRALAVLVEFPSDGTNDEEVTFSMENPAGFFNDLLNKTGFDADGATGSVHEYFYENSSGQFDLQFDVYGPVTLSRDISFYGQNDPQGGGDLNAWNMTVEACQQLDNVIDFKEYDRDLDGYIDNVYVFYAGLGEASGGERYTVWPHAGDVERISGQQFTFDGVRLNHYACSNERRVIFNEETNTRESHTEGIGTVCHEFTHVLGFPDLYDTKSQGASFTPGSWSVMDVGSHNNLSRTPPLFSAYERFFLGWLEPEVISGTESVTLNPLSDNVARIIRTKNENDFFILENRQQKGWDEYIPGHGMLVWHINFVADLWEANQVNSGLQHIDLIEADAILSESTRAGDAFPGTAGVTSFTSETHPAMLTATGEPVDMPLTEIEERNGIIYFKAGDGHVSLEQVTVLPAADVTPVSFTARWEPVEGAEAYKLDVYTLGGGGYNFVDGFQNRIVSSTSQPVEGLAPQTLYNYRVRAIAGNSESALSEVMQVTTPEASFEFTRPEPLAATDVTSTSFTANWSALEGAETYRVAVYTKAKGEPDRTTVDFTAGVSKLPEGWKSNCTMGLSMAGYFGQATPSMSMPSNLSYIQSPSFEGNIRGISFWYRERNNPSGTNKILVEGLVGNEWQLIDEVQLTVPATSGTTARWSDNDADCKIPADCKSVRITYRLLGKGALAIDDIEIAYNDKLYPVSLPGMDNLDAGDALSLAVTGLQPLTTYYYTVRGVAGDIVTLPSNETAIVTLPSGASLDEIGSATAEPAIALDGRTLTVDFSGHAADATATVSDMQGRIIGSLSATAGTPTASLTLPARGIYIVTAAGRSHKIAVR